MGMTKDEFTAAQQAHAKAVVREPESRRALMGMLRDAVAAEKLTGDPHWDRFLEWVSGALKEVRDGQETAQAVLLAPGVVSHDEMMRAKIVLAELSGHRKALEWFLDVPKKLRDGASEIRNTLSET